MAHSPDKYRRRRQARRAHDADPTRPSLLEQPTPAMRFRQFAAGCLRVPLASLAQEHIERVRALLPRIRAALATEHHADACHDYLVYLDGYFLAAPPRCSAELGARLGVSATRVRNASNTIYRVAHGVLLARDPALVAAAQQAISATDVAFWDRVRKQADGCWLWQGAIDLGYGVLKRNGRKQQAHRYGYELVLGPIADGMHVVHTCRVRACVNPAHCYEALPGEIFE